MDTLTRTLWVIPCRNLQPNPVFHTSYPFGLYESVLAAIELGREFYENIHEYGEGYLMIALRVHPIRVVLELVSTVSHTPQVPDSVSMASG